MSTQCAVVSGAGAGIGRAIAQLLDRQGYYVVGIDWNAESAAARAGAVYRSWPGAGR